MANATDNLYSLLPAVYRQRDAEQNYALRALLQLLGQQGDIVKADIEQLYENLFIETCQDWVIPYIGDLVSNHLLYDSTRITQPDTAKALFPDLVGKNLYAPVAIRVRADVAKTIYYRRRKSTPAMLEELARDVTGWPAHVVEFFQLLGWTQFLEHLRPQCQWTDLRSLDRMERLYTAFDECAHTVDVRQPAEDEGWHNIRNIGFFLWRLQSYSLDNVPARVDGLPWRYHFSPLGNPAPMFARLRPLVEGAGLVNEIDISAPIRRLLFYDDLQSYAASTPPRQDFTELYGPFDVSASDPTVAPQTSIYVVLNGTGVNPAADPTAPPATFVPQVLCKQLNPWPSTQPSGKVIGIDVVNGRLAIGDGWGAINSVDVSYWYGFSSGLGGGTYDRQKWLVDLGAFSPPPVVYQVQEKNGAAGTFTTVKAALQQWQTDNKPRAIVSILDSRTYQLPDSIQLPNDGSLTIEAANLQRPLLQTHPGGLLNIDVAPPVDPNNPDRTASFTLSGVVIEGFLQVIGDLGVLRILHSTLIPGTALGDDGKPTSNNASLIVNPKDATGHPINQQLRIEMAFSITGQLIVPNTATGIWLLDCIVQGIANPAICDQNGTFSAPLTAERTTFFGQIFVDSLQASEVIFTATVTTKRTQQGCVRFSYLTPGSKTPRRFHCQPDLAISIAINEALASNPLLSQADQDQIANDIEGWLVPSFVTTLYGQPAYAQLRLACPREISTGAEDGSEMGAFCHLKQPQRESNLKIRLQEYLPFGLQPAIIYVT